jgi:hypothetical protein
MGGVDEEGVFYYRVHNPVMLLEFDHQRGLALGNERPSRNRFHTVVGADAERQRLRKDLLRQHDPQFGHTTGKASSALRSRPWVRNMSVAQKPQRES